ncbi:MAG: DnaJ domain-containing protein [Promethearchaeota archaeon]
MKLALKEAYKILGLKYPSNIKEVKSKFRKLAKQFHPDVCKDDLATEKFKELYIAYEIILKSLGEPISTIEADFADELAWYFQRRARRVTADMDPFEVLHENYWMPKIAKMLENLKKRRESED